MDLDPPPFRRDTRPLAGGTPLVQLTGIGQYLAGSPWEVTALRDVTLHVDRGEGLLIVGGNGSGKSTLCVDPRRAHRAHVGDGALRRFAHQQTGRRGETDLPARPAAAAAADAGRRHPSRRWARRRHPRGRTCSTRSGCLGEFAARSTDALSGGQMRRGVLAGALAGHRRSSSPTSRWPGWTRRLAPTSSLCSDGCARRASPLIVISHDLDEIAAVCDRQVELVSTGCWWRRAPSIRRARERGQS